MDKIKQLNNLLNKHLLFVIFTTLIVFKVSAQTTSDRTLTQYLKELSAYGKSNISFSPSLTDKIYPVQVLIEGEMVDILDRLLKSVDMSYKIVDEVYVIYPYRRPRAVDATPKFNPKPIVVDRYTISPVSDKDTLRLKLPALIIPRQLLSPEFSMPRALRLHRTVNKAPGVLSQPKLVVKTNLLHDVLASINLGVEFAVAPKWTIDISVSFNSWKFLNNRKWKHAIIQPEIRYWFCERFSGHFVGAHFHGGIFNLANLPSIGGLMSLDVQRNRYEGQFYGFGISYGYHWMLNNRWSLESSIGFGYARIAYDKFLGYNCGRHLVSGVENYIGPTKVAISLIYTIK